MLTENIDFYYEGSYMVFTETYHLKRGFCCGNGCRHCPYKKNTKMNKNKIFLNWSGGKDSTWALYQLLQNQEYELTHLMCNVNKHYGRISMHGVRESLLDIQAQHLNTNLHKLYLPEQPTMEEYETLMSTQLNIYKEKGITKAAFGDLFLEDLRANREEKLKSIGFEAVFPIWGVDTKTMLLQFLEAGFKTIVVCVDAQKLDKSFAGRIIDHEFIKDLPADVDVCGENGEFHTFCFDGPIFSKPVEFEIGETVFKSYKKPNSSSDVCTLPADEEHMGFWFTDLIPK